VASIPSHEEKRIVLDKFGQVLNLPELPVRSCARRTPTRKGKHTHMPAHAATASSRESIYSNKKAAASQGKSDASETTTKPFYC